jgi:hypothetical protein
MNKGSAKKGKESRSDSDEAAKRKAGEAAKAKAEELRTAIEGKGEQGKSSLGSVPDDEDKTN